MARNLKGITLEIGGDTSGLQKAMSGANKEIKNTQSQLKDVQRLLKMDPGNTELLRQQHRLLGEEVDETKKKLEALKEANKNAGQALANEASYQQAYQPLKQQIEETEKKMVELKKQDEEMKKQLSEGKITQGQYDAFKEEMKSVEDEQKNLLQAKKDLDAQFSEGHITQGQYDALQREIIETENNLKDLQREAENSYTALVNLGRAGDKVQQVGGEITGVGKKMLPATAAIAGAGVASAKMAMDFEDSMAKVNTIADTTQVPLSSLEDSIVELSDKTGISASEIASNVYDAISAGQKTGDAVNFVSNSTKLARAGFADAGSALDVLTTIMNAYGLEASEVTNVSDVLIQTQNLGKTTVGELSSSMGKIIPTAKANGVALEQVATGYAIMTSNGVATAESTTYMNSMLNELGKSGTKVSDTLKEKTGQSFSELMQSGASLSDVLQIVSDSAAEQGLAFTDLWSSSEAGKAGMILLGDSADKFNGTLEQMKNSTGATDSAFEKLDTNSYTIEKAMTQAKNAMIELGSTIMEMLAPTIEAIAGAVKDFTTWFSKLPDGAKKMIVTIAGLVAAIGPALIVIGKITTGIGGVMKVASKIGPVISGVGKAFSFLTNPVGLIIAAIAALVAGFIYLWNNCEGFRNFWIDLWEKIKEIAGNVVDALVAFFTETIPNAWNAVIDFFSGIPAWWSGLWQSVKETLSQIWNTIVTVITTVATNIWNTLTSIWQNICSTITNIATTIWNVLTSIWNTICSTISNIVTSIWNTITSIWNSILSTISNIVTNIWNTITSIWNSILGTVSGIVSGIASTVSNVFTNMKNAVSNIITGVKDAIVNGFNAAIDFITALPAQALQWGADFINGIINGIKGAIGGVIDAVSGVADTIRSYLHFSVPDIGPLSDADEYGGDFIQLLSQKMIKALPDLKRTVEGVADAMTISPQAKMQPAYAGVSQDMQGAFGGMQPAQETKVNDIIIPVYIAGNRLDELVVTAGQRANYRSGGR